MHRGRAGVPVMTWLRILFAVLVNGVPIGGLLFRGWSPSTALALYWCETIVGSLLMGVRIALHRSMTRKRGHLRPAAGVVVTTERGGRRKTRRFDTTFLGDFLVVTLAFTAAHGVFLAAIFGLVLKSWPDRHDLVAGVAWMTLAQVLGFAADLVTLRGWSFAYLNTRAGQYMGRVGLMHFSILGGMFIAALNSRPTAVLAVFGVLKTMADIAGVLPVRSTAPAEAPAWFLWMARRLGNGKHWKTGQDPATWWRETTRAEVEQAERDEQVVESGPAG